MRIALAALSGHGRGGAARQLLSGHAEPLLQSPVIIIANNSETIEGLPDYLRGAGIAVEASRRFLVPASAAGVVIFPDEFAPAAVVQRIVALREARPELLIVVVTGRPRQLKPALSPDGHSLLPVVLPKPAFGWTILDAIRGQARDERLR